MSPPHDLSRWPHPHRYQNDNSQAERGTRRVMWITLAAMLIEIAAGGWYHSMALLADGWHMSSHALAIGLATLAYATARKYADDPCFTFGPWKIEVLAGYTSALFLIAVAGAMILASLDRLWRPEPIHYAEAMLVAIVGLLVNLACALILGQAHDHAAHDATSHPAHRPLHGQDLNLKAAYLHVLTDALTSLLAIVALAGGWLWGWHWLDPAMGLLGGGWSGCGRKTSCCKPAGSCLIVKWITPWLMKSVRSSPVYRLPGGHSSPTCMSGESAMTATPAPCRYSRMTRR